MSAAKHTPGPWRVCRWDDYGLTRFYVSQDDGAPFTPDYSDVATAIAETVSSEKVAIQEANARLIAAAPELLEMAECLQAVCARLIEQYGPVQCGVDFAALGGSVNRVIAKATGQEGSQA